MPQKIIFYELNEVPKKVFETWARLHPNSAFGTLLKDARKVETIAQDVGHLSPWVTWPSLHRGVSNVQHNINHIGQDLGKVNIDFPPVWEFLNKRNIKVGVFGSLQSYPLPNDVNNYSFYVPDTFAAGSECFPEKLSEFQAFNLGLVAQNGKDPTKGVRLDDAVKFIKAAPGLGLKPATVMKLAKQVISERIIDARTVRRRTSQAEIAFDFYFHALKKSKPDISFFFTNHVASAMHRYWPAMYPGDYKELKYDDSWLQKWRDEIPFSLRVADYQLNKLINFVKKNNGWKLIVASSMGQEAVEGSQAITNQGLITDLEKFLSRVGIDKSDFEMNLAMIPQMVISLKTDNLMEKIKEIGAIKVNGIPIKCESLGGLQVQIELNITNQDTLVVHYKDKEEPSTNFGIELLALRDAAGANAYHIPQGVFLDYDPRNPETNENWDQASALSIAPSLLKHFSVDKPSYMTA
jgi:hypothetical protein